MCNKVQDCTLYLGGSLLNKRVITLPHYSCLSPNLHSKDICNEDEHTDDAYCRLFNGDPFLFKYSLPLPLLRLKKPPKLFLYGKDPGLDSVYRKTRWKEIIQRELGGFVQHNRFKDIPYIKRELRAKRLVKKLPSSVILLAKLLEYDPDDQFEGFYNWYYYGGCLSHVNLQGNEFLLKSGGMKSDRLDIVPFNNDGSMYLKPVIKSKTEYHIGNKKPIYQVVTSVDNEFVGLRQKNECHVLFLMENSDILRFSSLQTAKSSHSFTSIDFDQSNNSNYVTMDTGSKVVIRNADANKSSIRNWTVPGCSGNSVDKWCCAQYGQNRDSIICTNRQYIRTYDSRAKKMNAMEFCFKDCPEVLEKCEEICCIVEGSKRTSHPLLYVATNHSLLGMDLRFPRAFVQRWTHGMESAPSYACVACVDGDVGQNPHEVVTLRSQVTNELHAIVNCPSGKLDSAPLGNVFPMSLPSYSDTLMFGQWHGKLLKPLLQRRLSMSTVGMCSFSNENGVITCLSQNSIGDVFQQHLIPVDNDCTVTTKQVVHCLSKWERSCPKEKRPRKKLVAVVRTDMKNLVNRVKNRPGGLLPKPKKIKMDWTISKRQLFSYDDLLVDKIREVWQLNDEPEWKSDEEDNDDEPSLPLTQEPLDRVRQWLGNANMFTSTPVAMPESQETNRSSFQPHLLEHWFSDNDDNMSPHSTLVTETRRRSALLDSKRAKRRRIDGF